MKHVGEVRRSQLITTFGIGSIIDLPRFSAMIAGQSFWREHDLDVIREKRLEKELRFQGFDIDGFRAPKPAEDYGHSSVPCFRFPEWVMCRKCGRLAHYKTFGGLHQAHCLACGGEKKGQPLVPSRFIMACTNGHIDDFPWVWWVHQGSSCDKPDLRISESGRSTALSSIRVKCVGKGCTASRTMEGAFSQAALAPLGCSGRRPWIRDSQDCKETPRVLQRGASNVYFPTLTSAISIPPFSEAAQLLIDRYEPVLSVVRPDALAEAVEGLIRKGGLSLNADDVIRALESRKRYDERTQLADIREDEYAALCSGSAGDPESEFYSVQGIVPDHLKQFISKLTLVKKLREVRALLGFSRIDPNPESTSPLSLEKPDWLPAVETRGEGVFIELSAQAVGTWLSDHEDQLMNRTGPVGKRWDRLVSSGRWQDTIEFHPVFLMLHTLSHLLVRQLTLDCGYSNSALRERLYVKVTDRGDVEMSGILIYTATTDSEGSLGGLVRQAEESRFNDLFGRTIEDSAWCSNDPLCGESSGQGMDSLNLAACYACALLPETACEYRNCLLDRGMLVGSPKASEIGFFNQSKKVQ